jgi:Rieske Fe-S protein
MPNHVCSRRIVLKVLAAGGAAGTLASACSSPAGSGADPNPVGTVQAGIVADYPVGSLEAVGNLPVAVGRDANGLYALTLTCTHSGCNMATEGNVSASGILCGCHGSRFDANGGVTRGPAQSPLAHYAVTVDASGTITVHGDQTVAASVRTAVA